MTLLSNKENPPYPLESGVTLLEMIVVLVIISISLIIVAPNFKSSNINAASQYKIKEIMTLMSDTRNQAIRKNKEFVFFIDVENKQYWSSSALPKKNILTDFEVKVLAAETEYLNEMTGGIRFYPDGSSTGGTISLNRNNESHHINVDWLTGHTNLRNDTNDTP